VLNGSDIPLLCFKNGVVGSKEANEYSSKMIGAENWNIFFRIS